HARHIGDKRLATRYRAGELTHVGAEIVGLDQAGQGTAFAQGGDVAGGGDVGQHLVRLRDLRARPARRPTGKRQLWLTSVRPAGGQAGSAEQRGPADRTSD